MVVLAAVMAAVGIAAAASPSVRRAPRISELQSMP
jgi:hypothetical protein